MGDTGQLPSKFGKGLQNVKTNGTNDPLFVHNDRWIGKLRFALGTLCIAICNNFLPAT